MTSRYLTIDFLTAPAFGRRLRVAAVGESSAGRVVAAVPVESLGLSPVHRVMVAEALHDVANARELGRPDALGPQFVLSTVRDVPSQVIDLRDWLREATAADDELLSTLDVPQADDLDRVVRVVMLKDRSALEDGISGRQWSYYRHAATLLGLLDEESGQPTSEGRRVHSLGGAERRAALAERFSRTRCGRAWMGWAGVNRLSDLPAQSAERFLATAAPGMSASTRARRAGTLERWRETLTAAEPT